MKAFVGVAREGQRRETGFPHDNAKFLVELPDQRFLLSFAGLDLASGELPQASHRFASRTLGEQHAAVGIDEGARGNKNEFDAHWPRLDPDSPWLRGLQLVAPDCRQCRSG
jgi:hypothetical protein